ncbi:MAG: NAD(+) diphosphatase [Bacteroidales bacterium]|nr:NAD(+) diphosphatase [Bacteroidales bacterium]
MITIWACLCAGDVLLKREGPTLSLPVGDEPPVELQPWNVITTLAYPLAPATQALASTQTMAPPQTTTTAQKQTNRNGQDRCDSCQVKVVRLDRPVTEGEGLEMMNLRSSFDVLDSLDYAIAGKAAELIYWDSNTKFCGCCGAPMKFHTEISKRCTNCGKEVWPQLATAVIVRITRRDTDGTEEVLLVHANNFKRPYYGLVAGFVETGETLEEAVQREVREETGLTIKNIYYFGSQPWPYPCGLMVGFTAEYAAGDIRLQRSELSSGGWFTRESMPPIPGKSSIARRLIDDWLLQEQPESSPATSAVP